MTLNVTPSQIQIKNSLGQVKFDSTNKLIWQRKPIQTGSFTIYPGADSPASVPFTRLGANEFLIISVIITACNGVLEGVTNLINKELPANGSILIDFDGRGINQQPAADSEHLSIDLVDDTLMFKTIRFNYNGNIQNGTRTVSLIYKARVWSYL